MKQEVVVWRQSQRITLIVYGWALCIAANMAAQMLLPIVYGRVGQWVCVCSFMISYIVGSIISPGIRSDPAESPSTARPSRRPPSRATQGRGE